MSIRTTLSGLSDFGNDESARGDTGYELARGSEMRALMKVEIAFLRRNDGTDGAAATVPHTALVMDVLTKRMAKQPTWDKNSYHHFPPPWMLPCTRTVRDRDECRQPRSCNDINQHVAPEAKSFPVHIIVLSAVASGKWRIDQTLGSAIFFF